MSGARARAFPS